MARKRGMQYIPHDYEAAYNKAMEDMHEWFIENLFQHRKKVMFINESRTAAEAEFIKTHIVDYEKIFDVCMNGDDLEFKKGLVRLQKMQNEYVMQREREETANE